MAVSSAVKRSWLYGSEYMVYSWSVIINLLLYGVVISMLPAAWFRYACITGRASSTIFNMSRRTGDTLNITSLNFFFLRFLVLLNNSSLWSLVIILDLNSPVSPNFTKSASTTPSAFKKWQIFLNLHTTTSSFFVWNPHCRTEHCHFPVSANLLIFMISLEKLFFI